MNNLNDIFFAPVANQDLTYDQVLEDVQRYFAENHASTIAEAGEGNAERATTLLKELMVQYIVKRKYAIKGLTTEELCEKLYEDMAGYSFLKKWIYKPGIEEVNINAYNDIEVIEAGGRSIKIPDKFSSPQHAIDVVRRMLNACGMVIDDTMPSVVGSLRTEAAGFRQRHRRDAPLPDGLHPVWRQRVYRGLHRLRQDHHHGMAALQCSQQPAPYHH